MLIAFIAGSLENSGSSIHYSELDSESQELAKLTFVFLNS